MKLVVIIVLLFLSQFVLAKSISRESILQQRVQAMNRSIPSYPDAIQEALSFADPFATTQRINILYRLWASQSAAEAYQSLLETELPPSLSKKRMQSMIISTSWIKQDPEAAIQAALETNDVETIETAFQDFAHQDGANAMKVARQLTLDDRVWSGIFANVDVLLAVRNVEALGEEGRKFVPPVIISYAHFDIKAAIEWLIERYPEEDQHFDALASRLRVSDPDGASAFLSQITDPSVRKKMLLSLERAVKISKGIRP
jgi:hypothetical protein